MQGATINVILFTSLTSAHKASARKEMTLAERVAFSMGTLVQAEKEVALAEFASQFPGQVTAEECMAHHVRQIVQTVTSKPAGRVTIYTEIHGKRRVDDVTRYEAYDLIPSFHGRNEH